MYLTHRYHKCEIDKICIFNVHLSNCEETIADDEHLWIFRVGSVGKSYGFNVCLEKTNLNCNLCCI